VTGEIHRGRSVVGLVCFASLMLGLLVGGFAADRAPGALRVVRSSLSGAQKPSAVAARKEESRFGQAVAISANGEFALIGAPGPQMGQGAAWVFKRSGATWVQQGPPLRAQGASHHFGESVALSANGEIALVGAPREQGAGEAWVFKRSGSRWAQQGHALRTGKRLGEEVALSANGEIALVSATDHGTSFAGVFERSGSGWAQGGELTAGVEGTLTAFGSHVALSASGEIALVSGASGSDGENAVWTFKRSGSEWVQQGSMLTVGAENGRGFGTSVALSADGTVALIGGSFESGGGAAWAFKRSGSTWVQQGRTLTGAAEGQEASGHFGGAVALSADGKVALIGAPGAGRERGAPPRRSSPAKGTTWVFEWLHGAWTPVGGKLPRSGRSVALSGEGDLALVGSAEGVQVFERSAPHGTFHSRGAIAPTP
jgi:hypothetical protein